MAKVRMTPGWLAALDAEGPTEWVDTQQRGLVLRVRAGQMVWAARYLFNGEAKRYRIGEYPAVGLAEARRLVAVVRGRVAAGDDPQDERRDRREAARQRRLGATVGQALDSWRSDTKRGPAAKWKGGLTGGSARSFLPHAARLDRALGDRLLVEVMPRDVETFAAAPQAAATRNRALTLARMFFGWAVRSGLIETNPALSLKKESEEPRTRVLNAVEIQALVTGFDGTRYAPAMRLLFLTGLRRDEVLGMQWRWIDMDQRMLTVPPEAEKAGRTRSEPRRVPLSGHALALLAAQRARLFAEGIRSEYVFATQTGQRPHGDALKPILYGLRGRQQNGQPSTPGRRGKPRTAVLPDDVTIHDIRRTVADALLNRIGTAPWIVDHVVLGHVRPKLLRTYMPTLPLGEARDALQAWGDVFTALVSGTSGGAGETRAPAVVLPA